LYNSCIVACVFVAAVTQTFILLKKKRAIGRIKEKKSEEYAIERRRKKRRYKIKGGREQGRKNERKDSEKD
jgi:hypothetical protein